MGECSFAFSCCRNLSRFCLLEFEFVTCSFPSNKCSLLECFTRSSSVVQRMPKKRRKQNFKFKVSLIHLHTERMIAVKVLWIVGKKHDFLHQKETAIGVHTYHHLRRATFSPRSLPPRYYCAGLFSSICLPIVRRMDAPFDLPSINQRRSVRSVQTEILQWSCPILV